VTTYATAFGALADRTRREILESLATGELSVGQIASRLPVSRPAISQHLRVLEEARLVTVRIDGRRRLYRLCTDGLEPVRTYLNRFWEVALYRFREAAEQIVREGGSVDEIQS
jgi:DNA-binding transcriptional ArsR family regulator